MKLLELYEDLFQYVCRLRRAAKTEAHPEYESVRGEVRTLLEKVGRNASGDVRLLNQTKRLELPMIFFVDNLICTSRLKFATQWATNRLARERQELAGDERFFVDFLEKDLVDSSEEAAERLAVYYVCFGLGFAGIYQGQPERIRSYVERIFPRVRQWADSDPRSKISEEAYRCTDTRTLTEPPSKKVLLVAVLFVFFSLSVLAIYYGLYARAVRELGGSVETILSEGSQK
jgi:type VI protein secretion system component VasF